MIMQKTSSWGHQGVVLCRAAHEWAAQALAEEPLLGVEVLRAATAEGVATITVTVSINSLLTLKL